MNLYFLDLFEGCKKGRRESISEDHLLPNGNLEGYHQFQEYKDGFIVDILKNGRSLIGYHIPFFSIELVTKKGHEIFLLSTHAHFHFHIYTNSEVPFEFTGPLVKNGFSSCLEIINFDLLPIRRKNFVKRTLTPTFVDSLIKN
jgi:hypothetical protein